MALILCQECLYKISDKAISCPKCGCPVSQQTKDNNSYRNNETKIQPNELPNGGWGCLLPLIIGIPVFALTFWICTPSSFWKSDAPNKNQETSIVENYYQKPDKLDSLRNYKSGREEYANEMQAMLNEAGYSQFKVYTTGKESEILNIFCPNDSKSVMDGYKGDANSLGMMRKYGFKTLVIKDRKNSAKAGSWEVFKL